MWCPESTLPWTPYDVLMAEKGLNVKATTKDESEQKLTESQVQDSKWF